VDEPTTGTGTFTSLLSRSQFLAILLAGAILRAIALPWPGTGDVTVWKVWSYYTTRHGVGGMYGVGGTPPERRVLDYEGTEALATYPPVAMFELEAAGMLHRAWSGRRFPNTDALTVAVKLPALAADIGLLLLLLAAARPLGASRARRAASAYWLNPAVIVNGAVLGYLDLLYVAPAAAAIVAATAGWAATAGALIAVAVLTKPQAIFIAPAVAAALWSATPPSRRVARFTAALAGAGIAAAVAVGPVIVAGGWPNMIVSLERIAYHDSMSSQACNLWWLVGWAIRVRYSTHDMGFWPAVTAPARILGIDRVVEIGLPDPKPIGIAIAAAAIVWALWIVGRRVVRGGTGGTDLWLFAALAAFTVHAYGTLSVQVHENHMVAAVPLAILAATGRRAFAPVAAVLTVVVALNHNLFYGLGIGYALPRTLTVVDATLVVSLVNCAALWWHAWILRRECSTAAAPLPQPAPA
jgi:hypothetical protein